MKRLIVILIFFETFSQTSGQITFERRDSIDWTFAAPNPNAIVETPDHGYLSAGSIAYGLTNYYYWEKIDSTGEHLWGHQFGYWADAYIFSASLTGDSGFILCGRSSASWFPMGIIKTYPNGSIEWYKIIGGQIMDLYGNSAIQTKDGGYIIAGSKHTFNAIQDAELIKLDSLGNYEWSKSYGGNSTTGNFNDIILTEDSGFIATGGAYSQFFGYHIFIVRTNSIGDTIWTKRYQSGFTPIEGKSITKTFGNSYVIAGYSPTNPYYGSVLIKINSFGDTLWKKDFGFMDTLLINSVEETNDSGLILSASKSYYSGGLLIKTNSTGDVEWVKNLSMLNCNYAIQTYDHGFATAGWYFNIIKTDSAGNTHCTSIPGSVNTSMSGLDQMFESINVQNDTLLFPAMGYYSPLDVYEEMICNSLSTNNPIVDNSFVKIGPIPAVNTISINSRSEISQIEIYNTFGTLIQQSNVKNLSELEIDISNLSPSIYFIKLYSKEGVATLKFLKN